MPAARKMLMDFDLYKVLFRLFAFSVLFGLPTIASAEYMDPSFYNRLFLTRDAQEITFTEVEAEGDEHPIIPIFENQIIRAARGTQFTLQRLDQAQYPVLLEVGSDGDESRLYHFRFRDSLYPGARHEFATLVLESGDVGIVRKPIRLVEDFSLEEMEARNLIPWTSSRSLFGTRTTLMKDPNGLFGVRHLKDRVEAYKKGLPKAPLIHLFDRSKKKQSPADSIVSEEKVRARFVPYSGGGEGLFGAQTYLYYVSEEQRTEDHDDVIRSLEIYPSYVEHCRNGMVALARSLQDFRKKK